MGGGGFNHGAVTLLIVGTGEEAERVWGSLGSPHQPALPSNAGGYETEMQSVTPQAGIIKMNLIYPSASERHPLSPFWLQLIGLLNAQFRQSRPDTSLVPGHFTQFGDERFSFPLMEKVTGTVMVFVNHRTQTPDAQATLMYISPNLVSLVWPIWNSGWWLTIWEGTPLFILRQGKGRERGKFPFSVWHASHTLC